MVVLLHGQFHCIGSNKFVNESIVFFSLVNYLLVCGMSLLFLIIILPWDDSLILKKALETVCVKWIFIVAPCLKYNSNTCSMLFAIFPSCCFYFKTRSPFHSRFRQSHCIRRIPTVIHRFFHCDMQSSNADRHHNDL